MCQFLQVTISDSCGRSAGLPLADITLDVFSFLAGDVCGDTKGGTTPCAASSRRTPGRKVQWLGARKNGSVILGLPLAVWNWARGQTAEM